jgi:hypothetical protein
MSLGRLGSMKLKLGWRDLCLRDEEGKLLGGEVGVLAKVPL